MRLTKYQVTKIKLEGDNIVFLRHDKDEAFDKHPFKFIPEMVAMSVTNDNEPKPYPKPTRFSLRKDTKYKDIIAKAYLASERKAVSTGSSRRLTEYEHFII